MKEKNKMKRFGLLILRLLLCGVMVFVVITGAVVGQRRMDAPETVVKKDVKYVFLFIGDGMGYSHVKAAGDLYEKKLSFTEFDVEGIVNTDNVYGEVTDSAAAATAMATGQKTANDTIGRTKQGENCISILETLKEKGWHTGVITTAPVNHATVAGFYAHADNRTDYYEIGKEVIESGTVDYLAGGNFEEAGTGENNLVALAKSRGYMLLETPGDVVNSPEKKHLPIIALLPGKYSENYMEYELDRRRREERADLTIPLAQLVQNGISALGTDQKFFMVVESAMIDSAIHEGDVGSALAEVEALDSAVRTAVEFAEMHKDETLILVTSDHETGGFSVPAANNISLYKNQKISWKRLEGVTKEILEGKFEAEEAILRLEEYFNMGTNAEIVLTSLEKAQLVRSYDQGDAKLFVDEVMNLLRKKTGVLLPILEHTNAPVALYASGANAEYFSGSYENTEIYSRIMDALGI